MKKIVYKYQISKFKRFANGLVFAIITCAALALCFTHIYNQSMERYKIIIPFCIAIISMTIGFYTMFHENRRSGKKLQVNNARI